MSELKSIRDYGYAGAGSTRTKLYGVAYGQVNGDTHRIAAFPDGSDIPAGRFLVHSPNFLQNSGCMGASAASLSVILPDRTGKLLMFPNRTTTFENVIAESMDADGKFRFLGVSTIASSTCKKDCTIRPCCPIGYMEDMSKDNYWPRWGGEAVDIATKGWVTVYTESDVKVTDKLHVRVEVTDTDGACQYIGGVTATPDEGTQELDMNYRILAPTTAGEALRIQLD